MYFCLHIYDIIVSRKWGVSSFELTCLFSLTMYAALCNFPRDFGQKSGKLLC